MLYAFIPKGFFPTQDTGIVIVTKANIDTYKKDALAEFQK